MKVKRTIVRVSVALALFVCAGAVAVSALGAEETQLQVNGVVIVGPPNGQTAAAPAARVDYSVSGTVTDSSGDDNTWSATAYRIDGGSWTCVDHSNVDSGSGTRNVPDSGEITLPGAPGGHTVEFRMHASSSCSESSDYSPTFTINPAIASRTANPNLADACGSLDVLLILDESGSITDTASYVTNVKSSAKAFVNGLKGTGANLAVVEFDDTATKPIPSFIPITDPVPAQWTNYIDNEYGSNSFWSTGSWTNWQDALQKTTEIDTVANADLIVFITDGDPTAYGISPGSITTNQPDGYFTGLKPAFDLANALKAGGSHLLVVGVGNAVGANADAANKKLRLKGIADDEELSLDASNIKTADVAFVANFADLEAALTNLATALCRSSVTVLKQVDEGNGQGYQPVSGSATGWQFTAGVTVSTGTFAWELGPGPSSTTAAGVPFQWKPSALNATSDVTITETVPAGYTMTDVTCTNGVTPSKNLPGGSFFIDNLPYTGSTTCTVKNKRNTSTVKIVKDWVGGAGSAEIFVDANGTAPYDASVVSTQDNNTSTQFTYVVGTQVKVGEVAVPAGYDATIDCGGGSTAYTQPVTVAAPAAGQTTTCTITNTKRGEIVVEKQTTPDQAPDAFDFNGEIDQNLSDGQSASKEVVPGSYTVSEAVEADWTLSSIVCSDTDSTADTQTRTATFNVGLRRDGEMHLHQRA